MKHLEKTRTADAGNIWKILAFPNKKKRKMDNLLSQVLRRAAQQESEQRQEKSKKLEESCPLTKTVERKSAFSIELEPFCAENQIDLQQVNRDLFSDVADVVVEFQRDANSITARAQTTLLDKTPLGVDYLNVRRDDPDAPMEKYALMKAEDELCVNAFSLVYAELLRHSECNQEFFEHVRNLNFSYLHDATFISHCKVRAFGTIRISRPTAREAIAALMNEIALLNTYCKKVRDDYQSAQAKWAKVVQDYHSGAERKKKRDQNNAQTSSTNAISGARGGEGGVAGPSYLAGGQSYSESATTNASALPIVDAQAYANIVGSNMAQQI